jgi:hypothetical protein
MCACAAPVKVYHYSWGDIYKANPVAVDQACGDIETWDDGTPVKRGDHFAGCRINNNIWVRWDCQGAKALPHELAHLDGVSDPGEDYDW